MGSDIDPLERVKRAARDYERARARRDAAIRDAGRWHSTRETATAANVSRETVRRIFRARTVV